MSHIHWEGPMPRVLGKEKEVLSRVTFSLLGLSEKQNSVPVESQDFYGSLRNFIIPHATGLRLPRIKCANCFSWSVPGRTVCLVHVTAHRGKLLSERPGSTTPCLRQVRQGSDRLHVDTRGHWGRERTVNKCRSS